MSAWRWVAARRRAVVWVAGAILTLGYYFCQAIRQPLRTAIGVERRLCGLGEFTVDLRESPAGGKWLLSPRPVPAPTARGAPVPRRTLTELLHSIPLPASATSRDLAPFADAGTWLVEGSTLRYAWGVTASGWLDEQHIYAESAKGDGVQISDLRRRRESRHVWSDPATPIPEKWLDRINEARYPQQYGFDTENWDPDLPSSLSEETLSSALEELPPDVERGWQYGRALVEGRSISLVYTSAAAESPGALYAVSDDPAPRIRLLTRDAVPRALSRDGRTLFFVRAGALWRLDLRQPLPALLDAESLPDLPDPLARQPR
jgi:hypothetical protein